MSINATRLHAMQLTYTIDGYDRCRQPNLASMPSHERKLSTTLRIPTMTYAEIYELRVWMVIGERVRKLRYGGRDQFWMFSCFSLLFFSSLWIWARYKWRRHGFLPPTNGGEFPCAPDPPKGRLDLYQSVAGLMILYEYVCSMNV